LRGASPLFIVRGRKLVRLDDPERANGYLPHLPSQCYAHTFDIFGDDFLNSFRIWISLPQIGTRRFCRDLATQSREAPGPLIYALTKSDANVENDIPGDVPGDSQGGVGDEGDGAGEGEGWGKRRIVWTVNAE
jgi:hypothetical protein